MGRLVIAVSVLALLLGGCASSLSNPGVVRSGDELADAPAVRGERALTPLVEVPGRAVPAMGAAPHLRLVSDDGLDEPPAGPPPAGEAPPIAPAPPAEPQPPEEPLVEVPADTFVPDTPVEDPRDVIQAPCAAPCAPRLARDRGCCWNPCEKGYVGVAPSVLPGLGVGIEFGVHVSRSKSTLWSVELGMQYQDLWREFTNEEGDGEFAIARIGMRVRLCPSACGHPTFRFGLTWFEAEGNPIQLDISQIEYRGDYIGAYIGVGYEWDLGKRWSMGPEFALVVAGVVNKRPDRFNVGIPVAGREEVAIVPMFFWHINYRL